MKYETYIGNLYIDALVCGIVERPLITDHFDWLYSYCTDSFVMQHKTDSVHGK